ncbi:hypothetical protein ACFUMJ_36065, partial [Streptomyces olivaceus]
RWIADQATEADLPPAPPPAAEDETVGLRDLEAAGLTPSVGQRTEMMLRGDDRLPAATLAPLDLARIRMTGPGPWTAASDTVAANAARRLWTRAYAGFADAAPEGTDEADASRAWSAAVVLVLPAEPHDVLADSRYAGEEFRDAVRRVADHVLAGGTDSGSAAELADALRPALHLHPRWTTPGTDAEAAGEDTTEATGEGPPADTAEGTRTDAGARGGRPVGPSGTRRPAPAAQSVSGTDLPDTDLPDTDMPDVDLSFLDGLGPDTTGLGDFDPSVLDGMDLDPADFTDFDFTDFDFTDLDFTGFDPTAFDTNAVDPTGPDSTAFDTDPSGDPPGTQPTAPSPTALETADGHTVFAAPVTAAPARPLAPLPRLSLVAFEPAGTAPSAGAHESVERLAKRVARAGLRNRRAGVPLPKADIAGYGADARGAGTAQQREHDARRRGDERARAAHDLFVQALDDALRTLQDRLPAGRPRLTARDFTVTSRGRARVPGEPATTATGPVSRTDLGRQATIAVTSPGHAAAVEALDGARRGDPALRPGAFDADAVARR